MKRSILLLSFIAVIGILTTEWSAAAPDTPATLPTAPAPSVSAEGLFAYHFEKAGMRYVDLLTLRDGSKRLGKVMEWADQVLVYDAQGRRRAYGVEDVRQIEFRRFRRHRALPGQPDLTVSYVERLPRDPSWHGRVAVEGGTALVEIDRAKTAWRPDEGATVTFKVHVLNSGQAESQAGPCKISVDGAEIAAPSVPVLKAGEEHVVEATWKWKSGDHTLRVEVLPDGQIPEVVRWNNEFEEPVQGLGVAVVVARDRYGAFARVANMGDSYGFADWVQYQLRVLNALLAASVYPTSPGGILERVRCDRIIVVDDPYDADDREVWEAALRRGGAADGLAEYAALMVFGRLGEDEDPLHDALKVDWPRLKQIGIDLGLVDLLQLDTEPWQCLAVDPHGRYVERGHVFPWQKTMMYAPGPFPFSETEAAFLNQVRGQPRGSQGDYLLQLPAKVIVEVRSTTGRPLPNVQVDAYQLQGFGEYAGYIAGAGGGEPIYSATTDESGRLALIDQEAPTQTSPLGYEVRPNPFGAIAPDGSNALLLLAIRDGASAEYHFLRLNDCNLAYLHGQKKEYVREIATRLGDGQSLVPPATAAVIVEERKEAQPPMYISWTAPPTVPIGLVEEFRVYKKTSFAGEDERPWNLVAALKKGPMRWAMRYDGEYFDEPAPEAGFSRDTFYAVSSVDYEGRESGLSGPGYLAYGKEALKFAIDRDAGYITLAGVGPGRHGDSSTRILRWDGQFGTQPFGVRSVRFPEYRPGFGGIAISADHRLVIADPVNHVLAYYDEQGNLDATLPERTMWPGFASDEPGEFNVPFDVAVDTGGQYYVADFGNNRVQILDSTGQFVGLVDEEFRFVGPHAVAIANGHLCVTDSAGTRCRVYDLRGERVKFVCELPPLIDADRGLVSRTGKVYITGRATKATDPGLLVYTPTMDRALYDRAIYDMEMGKVYSPRGMYLYINALDEDYGYCVNKFPFDMRRCRLE
ncbi:MAG TPA: CARDB domain-containing protein [Phycisphaerae bacterium]|nr:CARDB domain-containing protein [Phycisphaerae bacterium]